MTEIDLQAQAAAQRKLEERRQAIEDLGPDLGSAFADYVQASNADRDAKETAEHVLADAIVYNITSPRREHRIDAGKALIRLSERVAPHHHTEPRMR